MYYNQNDYAHIPYPAPGYESATIKSGGCGPTVMAMVIEDLLLQRFPPPEMAAYAINCGARISGGTNMDTLCKAVAKDYSLIYTTASRPGDVLQALSRGSAVIANVGGDRPGYTGLFSSGGHYVYLLSADEDKITVWDPGYYAGKFEKAGRKGRATVSGNSVCTAMKEIESDCQSRKPRYYILEEDNMTQDKFNEMADKWLESLGKKEPSAWAKDELARAIKAGITDGSRPQGLVTRQEGAIMALRAGEAEHA